MRFRRALLRFRRACLLGLAVFAVAASSASAWEKLPYTKLKPNDFEVFSPQALPGIPFKLKSPVEHMIVTTVVSPSPVTGLDGLLVPGDSFRLPELRSQLGTYEGLSNAAPMWWTTTPGTYYWQIVAITRGARHVYFGPVKRINIG
jgi:hypothetical protein